MKDPILLTRDEFREAVFKRDYYKCVFCGKTAEETPEGKLDAHHIIERRLWNDGGYYIDNGVTVCEEHHLECEKTIHSVEFVRAMAGIMKKVVPSHFYPDHVYDKWGNPILEDGRRGIGELFYDESVQKVLAWCLHEFTEYVKYERTFHLPWSPGIHDDDKALKDCSQFEGKHVVITRKMDGENTTCYSDGHVHARSIDSRGGEDRAWVKKFLVENVCFNLPKGWRVCGENLWAEHSIHYDDLKSYFLGFSIWNERNECLPWNETLEWFELLDITPVPVLWEGIFISKYVESLHFDLKMDFTKDEGYVVRLAEGFKYGEFRKSVAKFVRPNHVQTVRHWRQGARFIPNGLAK